MESEDWEEKRKNMQKTVCQDCYLSHPNNKHIDTVHTYSEDYNT